MVRRGVGRARGAWAEVLGASLALALAPGCAAAPRGEARKPPAESEAALRIRLLEAEVAARDARIGELEAALRLGELEAEHRELERRLALAERALTSAAPAPASRAPAEAAELSEVGDVGALSAASWRLSGRRLVGQVQALIDAGKVRARLREGQVELVLTIPIDAADPWLPGADRRLSPGGPPGAALRAHRPLVLRVQALADAGVVRARLVRGRVLLTMHEAPVVGDPWRAERR